MKDKVLTSELVDKLGWYKVEHITADMLEGYTEIGENAFSHCWCLTSVTIPNSVTSIGDYAFWDCDSLASVTIGDGVTSIGGGAFDGCIRLTSVTIPNSVTNIGSSAFSACSSLTSVTIPNSITSIGWYAFAWCDDLISVIIGGMECKPQKVIDGKCKAYKAFKSNMVCRGFQYEEGKTYEMDGEPILCERGFHACLNLSDVFNYYYGESGKEIHIHEVELEGVSKERYGDSKIVGNKITIGKRII